MSDHVHLTIGNGIARLTLDRPEKRNALRRETIESLLEKSQAIAADDSVRVFVLQATGKVFCAGMDLSQMQERAAESDSEEQWQKDSQVYCELLSTILSLEVPTIAAVQGPALAGGMGLVLACDMVVAATDTFFMLPEPVRGITAAMVTPLLVHRIGAGPATYLLLSNERLPAGTAANWGLCHSVVSDVEFADRVDQLIAAVLTGSPAALAITKNHIKACLKNDLPEQLQHSIDVSATARRTDDAREGLDAFLEKRKPNWQSD